MYVDNLLCKMFAFLGLLETRLPSCGLQNRRTVQISKVIDPYPFTTVNDGTSERFSAMVVFARRHVKLEKVHSGFMCFAVAHLYFQREW